MPDNRTCAEILQFTLLCEKLGLSLSSCIIALMRQAVRQQGISLHLTDGNGFTKADGAELTRRVQDVVQGNVQRHDLVDG